MQDVEHIIQVTSFGGAGTTMLSRFLTEQDVGMPCRYIDWAPWKHMRKPPTPPDYRVKNNFRAIFLFGNPMNTVISLFRRRNQLMHAKRLKCIELPGKYWLLPKYVENGKDLFEFTDFFNNWTACLKDDRLYPIMTVKYETMWEHLPEIFDFARVPREKLSDFPKKVIRHSDWESQPENIKIGLLDIYGDLNKKIEGYPDISVL